jgi:hypothetical protein
MFLLWKIYTRVAPDRAAFRSGQYMLYWVETKKQEAT